MKRVFIFFWILLGIGGPCQAGWKDIWNRYLGVESKKNIRAKVWSRRMGMSLKNGPSGIQISEVQPATFANVIPTVTTAQKEKGKSREPSALIPLKGLKVGDIILTINGYPVQTVEQFEARGDWLAAFRPQPWRFTIRREQKTYYFSAPSECNPLTLIRCGSLPKSKRY